MAHQLQVTGSASFAFLGGSGNVITGADNLGDLFKITVGSGLSLTGGVLSSTGGGGTGTVTSVAISRSGDALTITGSPITTAGTINIGFAGTGAQYIKGDGTLATFPTTILQAQKLVTEVYNETGATLTKGTVVYINGGHGNLPTVTKAIATGDSTSAQTYGVIQTDITNNNNGYVVVFGSLSDLDTSAYTVGTQLYLSGTTAGAWTSTKPSAPIHLVYVGIVVRSHPTQGVVEIRIQNGYELEELHNVQITSVANGDILQYDSATSLWKNVAGTTTNIAEGTNLYFTNARARAVLSTNVGSALSYNSTTGRFTLVAADSGIDGYLTGADWDYFDSKQNSLGTGTTSEFLRGDLVWATPPTPALEDLTGVAITSPTNGQVLTYRFGDWRNETPPTAPVTSVFGRTGDVVAVSGDYTTDLVTEATNLYYTSARARSAISVNVGSALTYNNTTGRLTLNAATALTDGYLTAADYTNFDSKQASLGTGTTSQFLRGDLVWAAPAPISLDQISDVDYVGTPTTGQLLRYRIDHWENWTPTYVAAGFFSATAPLSYNSGTGVFSISLANSSTNGYLSSTDWNTFNSKQSALTFTSPLVNTSGTITINQATSTTSGYLSSTDWNTFNGKQTQINGTGFVKASGTTITYDNNTYLTTSSASSTYVPYTGATANVDLGSRNFAATQIYVPPVTTLASLATIRTYNPSDGNWGFSNTSGAGSGNNEFHIRVHGSGSSAGALRQFQVLDSPSNVVNFSVNLDGSGAIFKTGLGLNNVTTGTDRIFYISGNSFTTGGNQYQAVFDSTFNNTVTSAYGLYVHNVMNASATNSYSLYIPATGGSGTVTNKWGIYQLGTNDKNYFAGKVLINTNTDAGYLLDVNGISRVKTLFLNYSASTLANQNSGIIWTNGTIGNAFGFVVQSGLFYQGDANASNNVFGVKSPTSDGTLGTTVFQVSSTGVVNSKQSSTSASLATPSFMGTGEFVSTGSYSGFFWENRSGGVTTNSNWYGWYTSAGIISLYNGSANLISIVGSTGNTLIGTSTDAGYKLDVNGTGVFRSNLQVNGNVNSNAIYLTGSNYDYPNAVVMANDTNWTYGIAHPGSEYWMQVKYYGVGDDTRGFRVYNVNGATVDFRVNGSGNGYFRGSAYAAGFFETSDKRIKKELIDNPTSVNIENVKPKLYIKDGKEELGYYAQDLQSILPSSVTEGKDGFLSLSYTQVHTAKIANLEREITELKQLVKDLIYELGRDSK